MNNKIIVKEFLKKLDYNKLIGVYECIKRLKKKGKVYVAKFQRTKKWPEIPGTLRINVTSGSMNKINGYPAKTMSPMLLGPLRDLEGNIALNFENYWQYGKKFRELGHDRNRAAWLEFRRRGYQSQKADRHPKGTKSNQIIGQYQKGSRIYNKWGYYTPYIAEYNGIEMDYITARKKIYIPYYSALVKKTEAFKELKKLVESGTDVLLLDYDGPKEGPLLITKELIMKKMNDPSQPYGHGYIIGNLLIS